MSSDLVPQSLRELVDNGLVDRTSAEHLLVSSSSTKRNSMKSRRSRFSQLDPNESVTKCVSEDSLSPDEFEGK